VWSEYSAMAVATCIAWSDENLTGVRAMMVDAK